MQKIILIFTLFFNLNQNAIAIYDVNENCQNAWILIMDLEIDQAKELLAEEIRVNPENYYAYYLDQTCDAYKMIINSDDDDYKAFIENYHVKREIMDEMDENSPYYLACSSEMEIQLGLFYIINDSQFKGVKKMYSGYRKVYRNLDKHPDFKPSVKLDGFFNVAMSNLPPFVKWIVSFFGVTSDIDYGFKVLQENYSSQKDIRGINAESALFVILAAKINKTPEMVYNFTKSLDSSISQTFILKYFKANIAYRIGKNDEALMTMEQIDLSNHAVADVIYSYLMGKILLRKLDDDAGYYLSRYLNYLEKEEYVKEMNYNLALYYLINDNRLKYLEYTEIVRNEGMEKNERDREALYDASLDYFPDVNLVKARLLLDGGYFEDFEAALKKYKGSNSEILAYKLEYFFLKGRFNVSMGYEDEAIEEFKKVIDLGEGEDYYFASEAALRLGNIYKEIGKNDIAKKYYDKSIKLYKADYYEYIHDKALKAKKSL